MLDFINTETLEVLSVKAYCS